jgi:hypothetical protein
VLPQGTTLFSHSQPTLKSETSNRLFLLKKSAGGYTISPCPYPTGETSSAKIGSWWHNSGTNTYDLDFNVTITDATQPPRPTNAFQNRKVHEYLSNWYDGCYNEGQGGDVEGGLPPPQYWAWWYIGSDRKYTEPDSVGMEGIWIQHYAITKQRTCQASLIQTMKMGPCSGEDPKTAYEPAGHLAGFHISPGYYGVYRDGSGLTWKIWPW